MTAALSARLRALGDFLFETGLPASAGIRINSEKDARELLHESAKALDLMTLELRWMAKFAQSREIREIAARTLQKSGQEIEP
jgi:hypothetical protein